MFEWPIPKKIDLESYPRKRLFQHFSNFEIPVTSRTLQIDITNLQKFIKNKGLRFSVTFGFILTRAINSVPELRHRIQDDAIVDFNKIIPSFTVLSNEHILYFAKGVFTDNFEQDYHNNLAFIERASMGLDQISGTENKGQIFITNIPWSSFTSIQHPYSAQNSTIPILTIGKMTENNRRIIVPLGIQSHHALVDGYHIGQFLKVLHKHLEKPDLIKQPYIEIIDDN